MRQLETPPLPKLVIDARMVGPVPHGIARYVTLAARGIEEQLAKAPQDALFEPWYLLDPELNRDPDPRSFPRDRIVWVRAPFLSVRELWMIPRALGRIGARLFWSPSFASFPGLSCPWMVTIHDLNHLHFGSFTQKLYYRFLLKPFAKKAKRILTVSQFSRREIARWLQISEQRVQVVYNAIDPELWQNAPPFNPAGRPQRPYFLSLGNPKPHKNLSMLIDAYRQVRRGLQAMRKPCWDLVITGIRRPDGAVTEEGICWQEKIPDADLSAWICKAGAMVFPSTYEGFGLPPVEAAALGVPVIVSDILPHREGLAEVQDSVSWFDPASISSLSAKLREAIDSPRPIHGEILRSTFTVEKLASGVLEILKEES